MPGVTGDAYGNMLVSTPGVLWVVAGTTGTFYGQAMTAGDIYTVAGDGSTGYAGDGVPGPDAALYGPRQVAVNGAGDLLIADIQDYRIREISR